VSVFILTRGLPGSGKTTRARRWVAKNRPRRCRVSLDDFRHMFHDTRYTGISECETAVVEALYATIRALLVAGYDVVSDSTWLNESHFQTVKALAEEVGAKFVVWDMRAIPPDVCIERDKGRGTLVGEDVILRMYEQYIAGPGRSQAG
jgi:predicted kinase